MKNFIEEFYYGNIEPQARAQNKIRLFKNK